MWTTYIQVHSPLCSHRWQHTKHTAFPLDNLFWRSFLIITYCALLHYNSWYAHFKRLQTLTTTAEKAAVLYMRDSKSESLCWHSLCRTYPAGDACASQNKPGSLQLANPGLWSRKGQSHQPTNRGKSMHRAGPALAGLAPNNCELQFLLLMMR